MRFSRPACRGRADSTAGADPDSDSGQSRQTHRRPHQPREFERTWARQSLPDRAVAGDAKTAESVLGYSGSQYFSVIRSRRCQPRVRIAGREAQRPIDGWGTSRGARAERAKMVAPKVIGVADAAEVQLAGEGDEHQVVRGTHPRPHRAGAVSVSTSSCPHSVSGYGAHSMVACQERLDWPMCHPAARWCLDDVASAQPVSWNTAGIWALRLKLCIGGWGLGGSWRARSS
jgi:hypothetical protein